MSTTDKDIEIISVQENPLFELRSQLSLFNELEKHSNAIPTSRKSFVEFVKSKVTITYNEKVINHVWDKILAKRESSNDDPIMLSSDDDATASPPIVLNVQAVEVPEVKSEVKISLKNIEHLVDPPDKTKKRKRKSEKSETTQKASKLKCRKSKSMSEEEADKLRMDLFLDKVLEVALPTISKKKKKTKSKTTV